MVRRTASSNFSVWPKTAQNTTREEIKENPEGTKSKNERISARVQKSSEGGYGAHLGHSFQVLRQHVKGPPRRVRLEEEQDAVESAAVRGHGALRGRKRVHAAARLNQGGGTQANARRRRERDTRNMGGKQGANSCVSDPCTKQLLKFKMKIKI
jgi:hypothetical protein